MFGGTIGTIDIKTSGQECMFSHMYFPDLSERASKVASSQLQPVTPNAAVILSVPASNFIHAMYHLSPLRRHMYSAYCTMK